MDCGAAALVGTLVLLASGPLSAFEGLPRGVLLFTGAVNLIYASFSFSLAIRPRRPLHLLKLLVAANLAWVPICLALAFAFADRASVFGLIHLIGEAVFVGLLASLEWRSRAFLVDRG